MINVSKDSKITIINSTNGVSSETALLIIGASRRGGAVQVYEIDIDSFMHSLFECHNQLNDVLSTFNANHNTTATNGSIEPLIPHIEEALDGFAEQLKLISTL